jgi:hypothetical protein
VHALTHTHTHSHTHIHTHTHTHIHTHTHTHAHRHTHTHRQTHTHTHTHTHTQTIPARSASLSEGGSNTQKSSLIFDFVCKKRSKKRLGFSFFFEIFICRLPPSKRTAVRTGTC